MNLTGVKAHKWQRISAVYLLLYFSFAIFTLYFQSSAHQFIHFNDWFSQQFNSLFGLFSLIAVLLLLVHAWVGGRDIMIDYLPRKRLKLWLKLYLAFLWLIAIDIIWLASRVVA